jgi:small-conductance mechanosensitive channel
MILQILSFQILAIPLSQWLAALLIFFLTWAIMQFAQRIALARVQRYSERNISRINEVVIREISRIRRSFILAVAFYLASLILPLAPGPHDLIRLAMETILLLQFALWGTVMINFVVNDWSKAQGRFDPSTVTTMNALSLIARITLWVLILLILLENIPGVQITSLVASLGITGIAVALAVRRVLSDLFASLSITIDKPFVLGDYITVDQYQGSVENIGLKSTRLRSLEGEQLIFSNSDLLNSRIHNYKRMLRRRVQFSLRISLQTPIEKLTEIPRLIQDAIASLDGLTFDRAHFREIGDSAYIFEVVYFVESSSYSDYMDKQQAINYSLLETFNADGVRLALAG